MQKYNIVFATDQNYIEHLSVALVSFLKNNSRLDFRIYIINGGIEKEKWQKLETITRNYCVKLIDICIDDSLFEKLVTNYHFTKAMYYRLLIPDFIDENKVLYMDADIVVNGEITGLYNVNMENYYIAAVENPGFNRHQELKINQEAKYFNSGIMLINNKKWKETKLSKNVITYVAKNSKLIRFPDQDGLNAIVNGNWKIIPLKYNQQAVIFEKDFEEKYNCFSNEELEEAKINPVIIHYTGSSKPWHFRNKHPYKNLYWKYLRMTPFKRYIPEGLTFLNVIKWMIPNKIKQIIKGQNK